jgi:Rps23 Pro-64 3,4-dihydroxylase Tpa1-like proline 4-hydroxylase
VQLNELFRDGFFVSSIDKELADRMLEVIKADTFVEDKVGSPDIAEWESDNPSHNNAIPPEYQAFMEGLGMSEATAHMRAHMGDWSRVNCMLQRGRRGDSMVWHHDSYDPMHMVCLVYFTDDEWKPEDGGQLQVGVGDIDQNGFLVDQAQVQVRSSISPNHGTVVWLMNTNPRFVHRVTEIKTDKIRYSMVGQFGYRENVMRTRVAQKYGPTWR